MNLNKAFILGNLTRDPETRALPSGQQVVSFGVATNRFYTDRTGQKKQDTEFHNVVCFGRLADISSRYLTKGALVLIEGRIKTRNWQDSSGIKHYRTEIVADNLQLGPRSMGAGTNQYDRSESSFAKASEDKDIPVIEENYTPPANLVSNEQNPQPKDNTEEIDIKDIPF